MRIVRRHTNDIVTGVGIDHLPAILEILCIFKTIDAIRQRDSIAFGVEDGRHAPRTRFILGAMGTYIYIIGGSLKKSRQGMGVVLNVNLGGCG